MTDDVIFEVSAPLGFSVRVTRAYWELIVAIEHPVMRGRAADVQDVLRAPDEIRRSRSDPTVLLFYRLEHPGRWICAITKRLNDEGFLVTTYPTDSIKEGERVWSK